MILIAAHGRSGTHYTSAVLQALGLDVPHESLGRDGVSSWKHIAPGEFVVISKNRAQTIPDIEYTHVFHQVRNPLAVIASAQTFSESSWAYMEQKLGLASPVPRRWPGATYGPFSWRDTSREAIIRRGMRTWLGWNKLIEGRAEWRYQIERFEEVFPEFLHRLGMAPTALPDIPAARQDSRQTRRGGYRPVHLGDLLAADAALAEAVIELAQRYGYSLR